MSSNSHQTIKKDEFYALLIVADLGVITPLRDGMNTTSMEFVIAQNRTKKSPLILSEFMGISSNMTEALQINPWNLSVSVSDFSIVDVRLTGIGTSCRRSRRSGSGRKRFGRRGRSRRRGRRLGRDPDGQLGARRGLGERATYFGGVDENAEHPRMVRATLGHDNACARVSEGRAGE